MEGTRNDRAVAMLTNLPFPPGTAPFRIKGGSYRGHLEYCDRFVPGGHRAVLRALGDPALDAFFSQPFLASARYDVFPLAVAGIGAARVLAKPFLSFVEERARWQANEDVNGIYRWLLRLATPEIVAARIPKLVAQYFDFGEARIEKIERGLMRGVRTGLPRALADWYGAVSSPYLEVIVSLAGGQSPRAIWLEPAHEGQAHGIEVVTLTSEIRWS